MTLPVKVRRKKQAFISIRAQMTRRNLARQATLFFSELRDFVAAKGIDDSGPGFMRYLSIGRDGMLDMEFGYVTDRSYPSVGPVRSGILPSGTFLKAEWVGPFEKLPEINAMLPGWASHTGIELDIDETEAGTTYACRFEIYHTSPRHTEDPSKFRTEILVLTRPSADAG